MSLRERLEADMKAAMKSRDTLRLETIRGVRGAMRNKEIELGESLDEDGILRVIRTLVKQRADSIEQFQAAGRAELVEKETAERQPARVLPAGRPRRRGGGPGGGRRDRRARRPGPEGHGPGHEGGAREAGRRGGRKAREPGGEAPG